MKLLRFGICALAVFAVAAHGSVEDWSRAVFETGAALLLLAGPYGFISRNKNKLLFLLFSRPWPLFPWSLRPVDFSWHGVFLQHAMELLLVLSDLILLFLAVQAFHTLQDWRGFVWFGMVFGFLICIFGILQHLTFNGKLYWFREMHYGGIPFGPYVNRNHFAGLWS